MKKNHMQTGLVCLIMILCAGLLFAQNANQIFDFSSGESPVNTAKKSTIFLEEKAQTSNRTKDIEVLNPVKIENNLPLKIKHPEIQGKKMLVVTKEQIDELRKAQNQFNGNSKSLDQ